MPTSFRLSLLSLFLALPALAAPFDTARDWRGDGAFRKDLDARMEAVRCRATSTPLSAREGYEIKGRCASPALSVASTLKVELYPTGQAGAGLASTVLDAPIQLTGRQTATGLELTSRGPVMVGETAVTVAISMRWSEDGSFTFQQSATPAEGGDTVTMVEVNFGP